MPNTLTNLIPDVYASLDVVSRELVGFIPAVQRDATTERAAVNQTVRSFVAPAVTASDITPGVTPLLSLAVFRSAGMVNKRAV